MALKREYFALQKPTLVQRLHKREITPPNLYKLENCFVSQSDGAITLRPDFRKIDTDLFAVSSVMKFGGADIQDDYLVDVHGVWGSDKLIYLSTFAPLDSAEAGTSQIICPTYSSGTVSITDNTMSVTGSGTKWFDPDGSANDGVWAGCLIEFASNGDLYVIDSITSDTALTISTPVDATHSGVAYKIYKVHPHWNAVYKPNVQNFGTKYLYQAPQHRPPIYTERIHPVLYSDPAELYGTGWADPTYTAAGTGGSQATLFQTNKAVYFNGATYVIRNHTMSSGSGWSGTDVTDASTFSQDVNPSSMTYWDHTTYDGTQWIVAGKYDGSSGYGYSTDLSSWTYSKLIYSGSNIVYPSGSYNNYPSIASDESGQVVIADGTQYAYVTSDITGGAWSRYDMTSGLGSDVSGYATTTYVRNLKYENGRYIACGVILFYDADWTNKYQFRPCTFVSSDGVTWETNPFTLADGDRHISSPVGGISSTSNPTYMYTHNHVIDVTYHNDMGMYLCLQHECENADPASTASWGRIRIYRSHNGIDWYFTKNWGSEELVNTTGFDPATNVNVLDYADGKLVMGEAYDLYSSPTTTPTILYSEDLNISQWNTIRPVDNAAWVTLSTDGNKTGMKFCGVSSKDGETYIHWLTTGDDSMDYRAVTQKYNFQSGISWDLGNWAVLHDEYRSLSFSVIDGYVCLFGVYEWDAAGADWDYYPRRVRWSAPEAPTDFSSTGSGTQDLIGTGALLDARTVNGRVVTFESSGIGAWIPSGVVSDPFAYERIREGIRHASNPVVVNDQCFFIGSNGLLYVTDGITVTEAQSAFDITQYEDFDEKAPIWLSHNEKIDALIAYYADPGADPHNVYIISLATGSVSTFTLPEITSNDLTPKSVITIDNAQVQGIYATYDVTSSDTDSLVVGDAKFGGAVTGKDQFTSTSSEDEYWYADIQTGELYLVGAGNKTSVKHIIVEGYSQDTDGPDIILQVKSNEDSDWDDRGDDNGTITVTTSACTGSSTAFSNRIGRAGTEVDGTETDFTLPAQAANARVYLEASDTYTEQTSGTDYTTSGTTVSFTSAPANTNDLYCYWDHPSPVLAVGDLIQTSEGFHRITAINTATNLTLEHYLSTGSETATHHPADQLEDGDSEVKLGINKLVEGCQFRIIVVPRPDEAQPDLVKISGIEIGHVPCGIARTEATGGT